MAHSSGIFWVDSYVQGKGTDLYTMEAAPLTNYWETILDSVRQNISQQTFETWFMPLRPLRWRGDSVDILCPDRFFMDWFSEHHTHNLEQALSGHFGRKLNCVFTVDPDKTNQKNELFNLTQAIEDLSGIATVDSENEHPARPTPNVARNRVYLNRDYTFKNFVVGSGSKLAHAASVAVSNNLGGSYNPLFIHGGVGLGKTHLMHAVGNAILESNPRRNVCYVTAEQFMNDLIWSIQQNQTYKFKQQYRTADVLLVDDVAFLAGKESTQEEFFHTFNTLYNENKQIVLTSDRPPKEIPTLEERLRSRFEWGLIVDIQAPDLETRIAILNKKVEANNIYIPDDVIEYIAMNVTNNIRNLEGALVKLQAFATVTGNEINLDMASEVLSSVFQASPARAVTIADIMNLISEYYDVTVEQLKSKRRTQDLALARQVAMYVAREKVGASLNQIGRAFGNRDHTTVLHACHKVKKLRDGDPLFRGVIKDFFAKL